MNKKMSLLKDIKKQEGIPIAFDQIANCIGPKLAAQTNLCIIDELAETVTASDIFKGKRFVACLITLYNHNRATQIRHWICIIKGTGKHIYFDSLGNSPKRLFEITNNPHLGFRDFVQKHCTSLNYALQKNKHLVNTCGYHVACRIIFHSKSPRQYAKYIDSLTMNADDVVTFLCFLKFHVI